MKCQICSQQFQTEILTTSCGHHVCNVCFLMWYSNHWSYPVECFSCRTRLPDNDYKHLLPKTLLEKFEHSRQDWNDIIDKSLYNCLNKDCDNKIRSSTGYIPEIFSCPQCHQVTCRHCRDTHIQGQTCSDWAMSHPDIVRERHERKIIEEQLIEENMAMYCVECGNFIERNEGCFGIRCMRCKTELCVVTQKARWGPAGRPDLSSGCGCRANKRCHPSCNGCTL